MNTILSRTLAISLIVISFIPSLIHAQEFEGVVTNTMQVPMLGDQKIPITVNQKGGKTMVAMDVPVQGNVKMFLDKATNKITIVMEAQKQGIEMDQAAIDAKTKNITYPVPTASGKKDTIQGYTSEEFTTPIEGGATMSLWMTKDAPKNISVAINASYQGTLQLNGLKTKSYTDLFKKGYVPLRTVITKAGEVQVTIEFVKAESKKLEDKIFVIPEGLTIQKVDPSQMKQDADEMKENATQSADTTSHQKMEKMEMKKDGDK